VSGLRRRFGSTRVRITVVTVLVVGVALGAGGWILDSALHASALRAVRGSAALQVPWVESLAAHGALPNSLPPVDAARLTLVQVVGANHRVLAASPQLAGVGSDASEDGHDKGHVDTGHRELHHLRGGPWFVDSATATVDHHAVTVVAFTSFSDYERALNSVDRALYIALPILLMLVGIASWVLVGRSLRPVERMRQEVDAITAGSLDSRVIEPQVEDEVGRLAVTLNSMLERLQLSADRQRRFIADASHELRTPVANVTAALEIAKRYPERADWPAVADDVQSQNERMSRLVDDLLLIARTEHASSLGPSGSVDLSQLVRDEVQHLSNEARSLVHLAEPLPAVVLDANAGQLGRITANLLENATRYARGRVEVSVQSDDDSVSLIVEDDGPGIPVDQRARVFEPFVRLDEHRARPGGGAGLGLAIVRDLVANAEGGITLTDGPLGGARFLVRLPLRVSA